jgi:hypothetical protein
MQLLASAEMPMPIVEINCFSLSIRAMSKIVLLLSDECEFARSKRSDHPVSADFKNCGIERGFSWMNELLRPDT